jgi:hypothetical protein
MTIIDFTAFKAAHNANRHPMDGGWAEEIEWKCLINDHRLSVCILDGQAWTVRKFGPHHPLGPAIPALVAAAVPFDRKGLHHGA